MYRWDRDLHDLTLPLSELQSSISSTLYINYSMLFISAFFMILSEYSASTTWSSCTYISDLEDKTRFI